MGILIDKLSLLFYCLILFALFADPMFSVAGLLALVIASSLSELLAINAQRKRNLPRKGKDLSWLFPLLYAAAGVFFPPLCLGAPLVLFDSLRSGKWWAALPLLSLLIHLTEFSPTILILLLAGCIFAGVFFLRVTRLENQVRALRLMRDEVAEQNQELDESNRRLADAQDNEIRIATLKERNRIAREIHDNVGHMLTRSLLQSGALIAMNRDENLKGPLNDLRSTLDQAMTSIRSSVHDLHDDSLNLKKLLEDSAAAAEERFRVRIEYDVTHDPPAAVKLCLAGIAKEAISNAIKYSNGDTLEISLREHPAFYQLLVMDNGENASENVKGRSSLRDTDRTSPSRSGIGLKNMKDRAEGAGGYLNITSSKEGWKVFASIPVKGNDKK